MKEYFLTFLFTTIGVLLFAGNGLGCVCRMPPTVYEEFARSHIVFAGKALSFRDAPARHGETERFYTFSIETRYRGFEEKTVEIGVGNINTSCSSDFVIGRSYLVYARDPKNTGFTARVTCGLVEEIDAARDQISIIKRILGDDPEPHVYGSLQFTNDDGLTTPLPNTRVTLKDGKTTFDSVTDENGVFRFPRVPKGNYTIVPVLNGLQRLDLATTGAFIVTKNGRIYTEVNADDLGELVDDFRASGMATFDEDLPKSVYTELDVFPNYGLTGKVTDPGGKPVKCGKAFLVNISMIPDITSKEIISRILLGTNDPPVGSSVCAGDGTFSVTAQRKGKYILVLELKDRVFFHPGTDSHKDAEIIELTQPTPVRRDFKLSNLPPAKKK